jgi:hypothetical protein
MQAILKARHQKFSDWIKDVKIKQPVPGDKLNELEEELQSLYATYLQKVQELRVVIYDYEERQKSIKNEIKRSRKFSLVDYEIK